MKRIYGLLSVLLFSITFAQQVYAVPLAGNYTVGGALPDYATIQAAVNALHVNGISAPVEFRLRNGTYNEQVTINDFTRTGAVDDTVTFRRQEALGTVTWQYNAQGAGNNWVIKLDGAQYITIRGMDFNAASASYFDIVRIEGGASNNIIEFCDFTGGFSGGNHIIQTGTGDHPNHTFRNNTFTYGDMGIQFDYAAGGSNSNGLVITDNTFAGQTSGAVETGSVSALLTGNIVLATTVSGLGFVGFDIDDFAPIIENNSLDISKGVAGIWVIGIGGSGFEGRIVNNLVAMRPTSNDTRRGIFSAIDNISIYHNTVRSNSTYGYPLWIGSGSDDVRIHNNILVNEAAIGGIALRIEDTAALTSSDHNNIYSTGSLLIKSNNIDYNTVEGFSLVSGFDANSSSQSVTFVSTIGTNDLHLAAPSDNDVDLLSPALASVGVDFDGDTRGLLTTYKGADEGTPFLPLDNADTVSGFYTIGGTSPDYSNPNLAITHLLQRGMKGPVTFRVRAGTYNLHRTLSGIVRSGSADDLILFRASNMNAPPDFQYAATAANKNWILRIQDSQYITFNFIDFTATGVGQYGRLIDLDGNSSDISVRNAVLTGLSGQTTHSAALVFSDDTGRTDLSFFNNTFNNGSYGLYLTTTNPFTQPNGDTLSITGNEFNDQTISALLTNYDLLTFSENDVQSSSNDMAAVYVEFNTGDQIHKNRFHLTGANTTAVVLEGSDGRLIAEPSVLANNFVVAATGFELNTASRSIDMQFNSIVATTVPINVAFNTPVVSSDLLLRNNILFNSGTGPAISVADGVIFEDSNYNNFINTSGALIDWQNVSYSSVGEFNTATGFGERSTSTAVQFADLNNADLHLAGGSIGELSLTGTPVISIPDDYDADTRSVYSPYMGADEASIELINEYSVGGRVEGLEPGNNVVLHNSNGDSQNVTSDGVFAFPVFQQDGSAYEVTVFTQPSTPSQFCGVSKGSGVVAGSHVTDIEVTCQTNAWSVGGTTAGLAQGNSVGLKLNGGSELLVTKNAAFTFPTGLTEGEDYTVTVSTQPTSPNQLCTLGKNSGTIGTSDITNITVTCVTETYAIGGSLSGLEPGNSIALKNNGGTSLLLVENGPFGFPEEVDDGEDYNVTIFSQPASPVQSCVATSYRGTLNGQDISNVMIACDPPVGTGELFSDSFE